MHIRRVVLIFPRFKYPSGDFPLGLAYIGGYLREKVKNLDMHMIDTTFNPSFGYVKEQLNKLKPDIVGIYSDTIMIRDAMKVAEIAKDMGANVMIGGPHATIMPESVIKDKNVDAIAIGEGELIMEEYINAFYSDKKFKDVDGIWYKKGKEVIRNKVRKPIENLDELPFPAFDLFDMNTYMDKFVQLDSYNSKLRGVFIIVSRGCPFECTYCQPTLKKIFGVKVRIHSPEYVIKEIKLLKREYGVELLYFTDDTLTIFKDWLKKFCFLLKEENINLPWACNTRADTVDYETLEMMKDAGCVKIKLGIEAITDRIRNGIYKKNITKKQINNLLKWANKLGIQVAGFFMLGAPTETSKEIFNSIWFAGNSNLVEANFSIATPLPKTGLYDYVIGKGWKVSNDFSCYDYYQAVRPRMSKNEVSLKTLDFYKKFAFLFFYLHPRRILITFRSMVNSKGFAKALLKLKRF